jgi:hypothetical protein
MVSKAACLAILLSFMLFGIDEMRNSGRGQADKATGATAMPVFRDARGRDIARHRGSVRLKIDSVSDKLTAPAENMVGTKSPWVQRLVPFALGMLFYGLMLHWIARWISLTARPTVRQFRPGY